MERKLNSVGKKCFVKYFYQFSDPNLTNSDVVEILNHENGYTIKACQTRVSKARSIIHGGLSCQALETIISSSKVDSVTRDTAQNIFNEICS
jgi:hypothetical protein